MAENLFADPVSSGGGFQPWMASEPPQGVRIDPRALPRTDSRFAHLLSGCYIIPGDIDRDQYLIPCSGGADSSFLAILMHDLYPDVPWGMYFTDTLAEPDELMVALDRIEAYLQKPIHRIIPERGLFEKISDYSGFLPSSQSRWCTRELKIVPGNAYMASLRRADEMIWTFVGIRADEAGTRTGLVSHEDHIATELPLQALGIRREHVFQGLDDTVGIPRFYAYRTRSGCGPCPFQRKSELVGLLQHDPVMFATGQKYEKLSEEDLARFPENAEQLEREVGIAANWLTLPIPPEVAVRTAPASVPIKWGRKSRKDVAVMPLFGGEPMASLWVGAEFLVNPAIGGTGVWFQRIVSLSTSKAGIQKQLQGVYEHRIQTPEVMHRLSVEDMKRELKLAYFLIEVPQRLMDVGKVGAGSYVWAGDGSSYSRLKHLYLWARRSLHAEGLKREQLRYAKYQDRPLTWGYEQWEACRNGIAKLQGETGEVLGMSRFDPVDAIHEELDERKVSCFMCSI